MKKVISLLFITLLITSCGKASEETNENVDTNNDVNVEVQVDDNTQVDIVVDDKTNWDNIEVIVTWDENNAVKIENWEIEIIIEDDTVINSEEDQLIEDAIREIDNIIKEIEADVK